MSRLISVHIEPYTPIVEPVTLQEAKDYLRVDFGDEDRLITSLIVSARQMCEKYLGLCIVRSHVSALYKNGGGLVELAYGPIETDSGGLPIISGISDNDGIKGIGNQIWIESARPELNLEYDSGFDQTAYPEWVKEAIYKQVAWDYMERGDNSVKNVAQTQVELCRETMHVLFPHRTTLHEFIL